MAVQRGLGEESPQLREERTRRDLIHNLAAGRATQEYNEGTGFFEKLINSDKILSALLGNDSASAIALRTQAIESDLLRKDQAKGIDSNRPITLAPNTTIELGPDTINAIVRGQSNPTHDAIISGEKANQVPPEFRIR
jgi:hypothetical protein